VELEKGVGGWGGEVAIVEVWGDSIGSGGGGW